VHGLVVEQQRKVFGKRREEPPSSSSESGEVKRLSPGVYDQRGKEVSSSSVELKISREKNAFN